MGALTDKDAMFTLMAYNAMKQRMNMLNGVGMGDAGMKKCQLIKRLTNQGYNLQVMGVNCIRVFLVSERDREEREREEFERQQKEKERILRRIMNVNLRFMGMGFRQSLQYMVAAREAEIALMAKQRGIMRRMVDSNARLMSAGYNKLIEEWKERTRLLKEKLKFVIKTLTDKDAAFSLMAYNQLKQRKLAMEGVGFGDDVATKLKIRLLRKLTDMGFNLQVMGVNAVKEFLSSERDREEQERAEFERQQKEKDRILRRIMDTNVRLMSAGWNKLLEAHKARSGMLKEKLRFVIKALTDKDAMFTLMAYNAMKQRMNMLNGVGMGDAGMKKCQLIKRLTNQGYNLQVMGVNCIREFLTSEYAREEREREEYERQQKEKERILRRIMNGNLRMIGTGFRQSLQWTIAAREAEIALMAKQRGIMRRIVDSNVRLMSAGWNKLLEE